MIGPLKSSALPGLHAISGADITGSLKKKGKLQYFKIFMSSPTPVLEALSSLGRTDDIEENTIKGIEMFICKLYLPKSNIDKIGDIRWEMFSKRQVPHDSLPPTIDALVPAIRRAHFQSMCWNRCFESRQNLPKPEDFGWTKNLDYYNPIMSTKESAPASLLDLTRCSCEKGRCRPPCKCATANMRCSEMCVCEGDTDRCDNSFNADDDEDIIEEDEAAHSSDDDDEDTDNCF